MKLHLALVLHHYHREGAGEGVREAKPGIEPHQQENTGCEEMGMETRLRVEESSAG